MNGYNISRGRFSTPSIGWKSSRPDSWYAVRGTVTLPTTVVSWRSLARADERSTPSASETFTRFSSLARSAICSSSISRAHSRPCASIMSSTSECRFRIIAMLDSVASVACAWERARQNGASADSIGLIFAALMVRAPRAGSPFGSP